MSAKRGKLTATASVLAGSIVAVAAAGLALEDHMARSALLGEIASLGEAVPVEPSSVERPTDDIAGDARRCEMLCREFLARWPERGEAWPAKGTLLRMVRYLEGHWGPAARGGGSAAAEALRRREAWKVEGVALARALLRRRDLGPPERHVALEVLLERSPEELGGLESVAALLRDLGAEYARQVADLSDEPHRSRLEQRQDSAENLLARVLTGLGDYNGARRAYQAISYRRGGSAIFGMYQRFLQDLAGRPPAVGLADATWVTPSRLDLEEARGSVVVLMTHGISRPVPSGERLQAFQRSVGARGTAGLVGAVVCFHHPTASVEAVARLSRDLREDCDHFGITLPAAVLSTARLGGLFPRPCSGTIVVLDRHGDIVWCAALFGVDGQEWSLTRMVLDRHLAEPRPMAVPKTS